MNLEEPAGASTKSKVQSGNEGGENVKGDLPRCR